jgi:hypothetical protein
MIGTKSERMSLLADWREAHLIELDQNLKVAKQIRDDPKSPPRVKMDAVREINKLFGVIDSIKVAPKDRQEEVLVSDEEENRIKGILGEFRQGRTA